MTSTNKRFAITVLVMAFLVGGSGLAIVYESFQSPQIQTETIDVNGVITRAYAENSLSESTLFNLWLGAVLGFGGSIMAVLYVEQPKQVNP